MRPMLSIFIGTNTTPMFLYTSSSRYNTVSFVVEKKERNEIQEQDGVKKGLQGESEGLGFPSRSL